MTARDFLQTQQRRMYTFRARLRADLFGIGVQRPTGNLQTNLKEAIGQVWQP